MRGEIVSAGVDWITATSDVLEKGQELYDNAARWVQENKAAGYRARTYTLRSWPMVAAGSVGVGINEEATLVTLSGIDSHVHWADVLALATNVSRLDIETTVRLDDGTTDVGARAYVAAGLAAKRRGHTPKITRYQTQGGHTTCYVGAPTSEVRLRLYDKTEESHGEWPATCWRYEVQLRDDHAAAVGRRLEELPPFASPTQGAVWAYFVERGVTPLYDPKETDWTTRYPVLPADADRRMKWLQYQVRPALEWLRHHRSEEAILDALGITRPGRTIASARKELQKEERDLTRFAESRRFDNGG